MSDLLGFIIIALLFFFLGWFFHSDKPQKMQDSGTKKIKRVGQSLSHSKKLKPGVIPFPTKTEIEARKSGDKALEDHWIKSGIDKLVKGGE